jgi:hypothetical protein
MRTGEFVNDVIQTCESQQYISTVTVLKDRAVYIAVMWRGT